MAEKTLNNMQSEVYKWAESKGWEPDASRTFGDECALIHSEVSEALEAFRDWGLEDMVRYEDGSAGRERDSHEIHRENLLKPEGVASEFADVLIRLLHYSEVHGFDLGAEYERKMAYNHQRAYRHGGKNL